MRLFKFNKTTLLKLFVFLLFGNLFIIAHGANYETFEVGIFSYTRETSSENNFVSVSINRENRDTVTEVTIPETVSYKGVEYIVNEISNNGFQYCVNLQSVSIPNTIVCIEKWAFASCSKLESISLSQYIENIDEGAFVGCYKLKNFIVDAANERYSGSNNGALYNKEGTILITYPSASGDVTIREGVEGIKSYCFYKCDINCLTLPSTLKFVEDFPFGVSISLSKVVMLSIVPPEIGNGYYISESDGWHWEDVPIPTYVPEITFDLYKSSKDFQSMELLYPYDGPLPTVPQGEDDTLKSKGTKIDDLFYILDSENMTAQVTYQVLRLDNENYVTEELIIPETITFQGNDYAVTSIGEYAFLLCDKITSVTFPKTIKTVQKAAFYNCLGISSVNVADLESLCLLGFSDIYSNPYYYSANKLVGGQELTDVIIPSSITKIPPFTFIDFNSIRSVVIGENIEKIGAGAFSGCYNLVDVTFNAINCTQCGSYYYPAFPTSLTSLKIGNNVTRIPGNAFRGCSGLTGLEFGEYLEYIGDSAFYGCSGLTSLEIGPNISYIGTRAFYGCKGVSNLNYNAKNCTSIGEEAIPYTVSELKIGNEVKSIPKYSFYYLQISELEIPENVKSIGTEAFYYCTNLKTVKFVTKDLSDINNVNNSQYVPLTDTLKEPMTLDAKAFEKCNAIRSVVCMFDVAPVSEYGDVFEKEVYNESELFLPLGKYSEYKRILPWKLFKYYNTHQVDFSGDSGVAESLAEEPCGYKVYSIDGRLIMNTQSSEALDALQNGLYIINGKKILINR